MSYILEVRKSGTQLELCISTTTSRTAYVYELTVDQAIKLQEGLCDAVFEILDQKESADSGVSESRD